MKLLEVNNLSFKINNQVILSNISFEVSKGDTLMIIGPNGAGKSTLLRLLVKRVKGVKWFTNRISYIPSLDSINKNELPRMTVKDFFNLSTGDLSLINRVGLFGVNDKQLSELSTGQFQRLMLAWSLINKPDVLILDEPTSGVDVSGEVNFFDLLHDEWVKGLTIIIVTHDLEVIWKHANKVLCLNKRLLCNGSPRSVLTPKRLKELYQMDIKFYKHNHGGVN